MHHLIAPLLLVLVISLPTSTHAGEFSGLVVDVLEGDTLIIRHNGRKETIRLNGIDAPEVGQPFGAQAKRFTAEQAFGKTITVVPVGNDRRDRTVADVFLPDDRLLNHELVKAGYAWWFKRYALGNEILKQLEADARKAKRGLWADKEPVPPWEWRRERSRARGRAP